MDYKQFKMERKREAERTARDVAFLHKLAYTGLNPWYKGDGTAEFKKPEPIRPVTTKATTDSTPATPVSKPPEPPKPPTPQPSPAPAPAVPAQPPVEPKPAPVLAAQPPSATPAIKPVEPPKQPEPPKAPETPAVDSDKKEATQETEAQSPVTAAQSPVTAASAIDSETTAATPPSTQAAVPVTSPATTVTNQATTVSNQATQEVPDYISQLSQSDLMDITKFKTREDWIRHGTFGNSLGSHYGRKHRAALWDRRQMDQELKSLAQDLGIDISNGYTMQRRFGQIVSINGVPVPPEKRKSISRYSFDDDDTDDWYL